MKRFLTLFACAAATLINAVAAPITMHDVPDSTPLLDSSDPFGFGLGFTYNGVFYAYTNQPVIVGGIGVEADPVAYPFATNAVPKQTTITINGETKTLGEAPVFTITATPVETDAKFATNTVTIVRDGVVKGFYGTNLYAAAAAAVSGDKITLSAGDYHIYQRGITLADGVSMSGAGSGVSRILETGMDWTTVGGIVSSAVVRVGSDSVLENVGILCDWSTFGDTRFIFGVGAFVETNVTIRNCYVRGASDAVYLKGVRNANVEWCDIATAFDGVMFFTDTDTGIGSVGRLSWSRVVATALWPTNEFFPETGAAGVGIADGSTGIVSFCELRATGGDLQNVGIKVTAAGHGEAYNNTIYVRDAGKTGEGWENNTYGLWTEGGYLLEHNNQYALSSGTITHGTFRIDSFQLDGTTITTLQDGAVNASTVTNIVNGIGGVGGVSAETVTNIINEQWIDYPLNALRTSVILQTLATFSLLSSNGYGVTGPGGSNSNSANTCAFGIAGVCPPDDIRTNVVWKIGIRASTTPDGGIVWSRIFKVNETGSTLTALDYLIGVTNGEAQVCFTQAVTRTSGFNHTMLADQAADTAGDRAVICVRYKWIP